MPDGRDASRVLVFFVNGIKIEDSCVDPEWTLLYYLRNKLKLCGTKLGCGEGGCGACTIMLSKYDHNQGRIEHASRNACLTPVACVHGLAVTTVEGIGSIKTGLHAVQERIAKSHGSQCGFCTPGIVMSMYTLLRNNPLPSMAQVNEYFVGNLCRCTGYRPILDGVRSLTSEAQTPMGCGKIDCCQRKCGKSASSATDNEVPDRKDVINCNIGEDGTAYERSNISHILYDATEFKPYDPSQDIIFPPELKVNSEWQTQSLEFRGPRVLFYKPSSLSHLLQLKALYPLAKIIVGNTEVGVEVKYKNQEYPVWIHPINVTELTSVTVKDTGVVFGASVTLTIIENRLRDLVKTMPEHTTRIYSAILEMLQWFAGKQIRNAAAIGGNIMTGSPVSDLNPLLMAARSTLTLCSADMGERVVKMDHNFFTGYRKNIVQSNEILLSVHIPFTRKDEYFFGYKQSRRRDDDIAIVNAGMKIILEADSVVVKRLDLAFGGMAPTTVMASTTMQKLVGKCWDSSLLEIGTESLLQDLPLSPSAPGGMISYRRALTVSFFFKFYLSVRGILGEKYPKLVPPLTSEEQRVIQEAHQREPKSTQLFQKVPALQSPLDPIGRPIIHASALKQATGEAVYVDDMPRYENELYAGFVFSTRAHARIIAIDEFEAVKMKGVKRFFCARDLPEEKNRFGAIVNDEEVFAFEKVNCVGALVGMVVADDQQIAQRAAKLVKIQYDDVKPLIITIHDAIREESYYDHFTVKRGNAELIFQTSANVLEGEMHVGGQEHFYMETNAHLAVPKCEDGEMEIFSTNQNPMLTQKLVAEVLGVPASRIVCRVKRLGGGFGGKENRATNVAVPLCVAASVLNRPVRIMLDRHEDMLMTGTRHPFWCKWKVSFTNDGIITALNADLYSNAGCTQDASLQVMQKAIFAMDNAYKCDNIHIVGHVCKTNLPSNTAFRGFGAPQSTLFVEDIISRIAAFLQLDPCEIRKRNLYETGDKTILGQIIERCTLRLCWDEAMEKANYQARKIAADKFNEENKHRKRGLSAVPVKFGIGFTSLHRNQAGALVHVYTDGSVLLSHGGLEMGQGLHTKMIQVAARVLKISAEKIFIAETSSDKVPNTSPTASSVSSDINGMAVMMACEKIYHRLEPFIAKNPKGTWEEWVTSAYFDRVSLSATGFYKTPDISNYDFDKQDGNPFAYFCFGAAVSEVEIDCLTGDHCVLRTDIVMDVGESLNPAIDIGQIEGAFMQGVGHCTLEELCYSPKGELLTKGPGAYKIPGFKDIPKEFNVSLLRGAPNPRALFSSKAVGEPPLLLAASVFYSIKEAIAAVRADRDLSPFFRFDSPATAERIRMACQDFITDKIESPDPGTYNPWSITV